MKKRGILFVSLLSTVMFFMSCDKTVITDTTPPAPVTELKASAENGKIILTWKDPSDSDLLGIKIYNGKEQARAVSLTDGILVGKGIQKYEVMGLENEKIYTFKVSAVDKALNESRTVESGKITFIEKLVKTVYVCPNCEKTYGTAKESADCCGVKIIEKKETHYAFVCPNCMEEYLSPQKAAACCGVQTVEVEKIVKKYLCPRDGKEYDTAEEAENCCGPELKYVCPKDYKEYETAQEAADCCGVQIVEVEKPVYKYICPNDHQEFETAEEAADCCGVQIEYVDREVETIVTKYVCPRDGREYDTIQEAENCCGAEIKYVCPKDYKEYETAEEAANCCGVQTVEVEKTVYKYVCPKDQKEYETAEAAAACCGVQIEYVDREVEKVVYKYVCPKDQKEYTTAQEAADCCGVQTVEVINTVYKYICPKDQKEYATAQEAADCCGVQIEYVDREVEKEVKKYVCPQDNKEYATAQQAAACCGPVEVEKLVYTTGIADAGTYTVYHLQQNTSGGKKITDYTLADKETNKVVATESTIAVLGKTYTGFTAKAMALNETVIYVFYDRNTITYTFNTGSEGKFSDGTTSKTVSGLYGASVSLPAAPVGNDVVFVGWKTGNQEVSSTFGAEDKTYTAQWNVDSLLIAKSKEMVSVITEITTITGDQSSGVFREGRTVTLSPYSIGKYEVTQVLYEDVMGTNPSSFSSNPAEGETQELRPVVNINWYRAIAFCNKLSLREGYDLCYSVKDSEGNEIDWANLAHDEIPADDYDSNWDAAVCDMTKNGYRLPTEAEWEFAARSGDQSAADWNYTYSGADTLSYVAWYRDNSNSKTHEVGTKAANRLGIYDMSGNVWELCNDLFGSVDSSETVTDPAGLASGSYRVLRGGCYYNGGDCSVFDRSYVNPYLYYDDDYGFRLARSIIAQDSEKAAMLSKSKEMVSVSTDSTTITGDQGSGVFQEGRTVTLSPYSIGKYEVTQVLYEDVMGTNPSSFSSNPAEVETQELRPVEYINWYRAIAFCNKLSLREGYELCYNVKDSEGNEIDWANLRHDDIPTSGDSRWDAAVCSLTKNGYRLPTEAEWEFAARGGDQSAADWNYTYSGSNSISSVAWCSSNSSDKTHEVGTKAVNRLGIYDMTGNVSEWCNDWYGSVDSGENVTNPSGPASGSFRVLRGGDYYDSSCAVSSQSGNYPYLYGSHDDLYYYGSDYGFRLARSADNWKEEHDKAVAKNTPAIGRIVMSDGSYQESSTYSSYNGTATPVGVVCKVNDDGQTGLMLGFCNSSSGTNSGYKQWAPSSFTGYDTKFTAIQCSQGGNAGSYTITGDTDGSDNWAEICKVDSDETLTPATYYPAFNYALKYASTSGLTGTQYTNGWYLPSAYELFYYVYQNKTILNSSISSAGGTILASDIYWSSSQDSYETEYAWTVSFGNGGAGSDPKTDGGYVCCLRAF